MILKNHKILKKVKTILNRNMKLIILQNLLLKKIKFKNNQLKKRNKKIKRKKKKVNKIKIQILRNLKDKKKIKYKRY